MNLVFMGTPDFAVPSLEKLIEKKHNIMAVYTQPDKPKGRGHKLQFSEVKECAIKHNLEVFQPDTLRTDEVYEQLVDLNPDAIIVVAYGKILPKRILDIPKLGCINVHGSILPKYRGSAPIQWSVLNGDKVTGVTTMFMGVGVDTGDILKVSETEIGENETSGELFDRLSFLGADLLAETLVELENGTVAPIKQNEAEATHTVMIDKSMSPIDWTKTNVEIHNQIRGLNPWPCAVTTFGGKKIKVFSSEKIDDEGTAGKLFKKNGELGVFCGKGSLILTEIQPENGKRMSGKVYLVGHPIDDNSKFE